MRSFPVYRAPLATVKTDSPLLTNRRTLTAFKRYEIQSRHALNSNRTLRMNCRLYAPGAPQWPPSELHFHCAICHLLCQMKTENNIVKNKLFSLCRTGFSYLSHKTPSLHSTAWSDRRTLGTRNFNYPFHLLLGCTILSNAHKFQLFNLLGDLQ